MATQKMAKAEMAVAVAKDVLKSLRYIKAKQGYRYVRGSRSAVKLAQNGADSKKTAQELKKTCNVCALGACLLSTVTLYNKFDFNESLRVDRTGKTILDTDSDRVVKRLSSVFSREQMALIEMAFERNNHSGAIWDHRVNDTVVGQRAEAFGRQHRSPRERLRAIMKNIVKNGGKFVPPPLN
jgi:hypothetical protein